MHSPIKHAATTVLQRSMDLTLDDWLENHADATAPALLAQLAIDTDGLIVVDRRTVERWRDEAVA